MINESQIQIVQLLNGTVVRCMAEAEMTGEASVVLVAFDPKHPNAGAGGIHASMFGGHLDATDLKLFYRLHERAMRKWKEKQNKVEKPSV